MKEEWKNIKGYPNYMVSNMGNVKSLNYNHTGREKIMKPSVDKDGYMYICLYKNGVKKLYLVHRLVAEAFISNPNNYPQVNHKDENPSNNFVDNLEWCDAKYNNNYGTRTERVTEKLINGKKSKTVLQINKNTSEIIGEWPSIAEINRKKGFDSKCISNCCKGKQKQSYGFKWAFKKEDY